MRAGELRDTELGARNVVVEVLALDTYTLSENAISEPIK